MIRPHLRVFCTILLAVALAQSAPEAPDANSGARAVLRVVAKDSYDGGMGRCSLAVKSDRGALAHFIVRDSGTALTRLTPGAWHVSSVHCANVWTPFPTEASAFEIPDSSGDLSLGSLVVEFRAEDVSKQVAEARARRRALAETVGMAAGGLAGAMVASEFSDELPVTAKVKCKAELRARWNDRSLAPESQAILGHSDAKRIAVKITRAN
jgi:hypothetical protein